MTNVVKFESLEAMLEAHRHVPTPEELERAARVAPILDRIVAEIEAEKGTILPLLRGLTPYDIETAGDYGNQILLVKPVELTRLDDETVKLKRGQDLSVTMTIGGVNSHYSAEEVVLLDGHYWDGGVISLATRGLYGPQTLVGDLKPFADFLAKAA